MLLDMKFYFISGFSTNQPFKKNSQKIRKAEDQISVDIWNVLQYYI